MKDVTSVRNDERVVCGRSSTFIKDWLSYLARDADQEVQVNEEISEDRSAFEDELHSPIVFDRIVFCENRQVYICPKICWIILKPLVRALSPLNGMCGSVHYGTRSVQDMTYCVWYLDELYTQPVGGHDMHIWFCVPTMYDKPFKKLLSEELGLLLCNTRVLRYVCDNATDDEELVLNAVCPWTISSVLLDANNSLFMCGVTSCASRSCINLSTTISGSKPTLLSLESSSLSMEVDAEYKRVVVDNFKLSVCGSSTLSGTVSDQVEVTEMDLKDIKKEEQPEEAIVCATVNELKGIDDENEMDLNIRYGDKDYSVEMNKLPILSQKQRKTRKRLVCPLRCGKTYEAGHKSRLIKHTYTHRIDPSTDIHGINSSLDVALIQMFPKWGNKTPKHQCGVCKKFIAGSISHMKSHQRSKNCKANIDN